MARRRRPSLGNVFANWSESDLPFDEKVKSVLGNNWKKLRTGSTCCGNHGDPGC
ncbi:MAG: hypothetical protein R3290_11625 [Acidimicrobiia bacterium]|nr:hypothetical protein [Acidimicrobiia bacterium]